MNPRDAEKLLGGYAAGILTEAEKATLFTAALDHQELFDALAEEEALRELLADPAAKAHLLSLLAPTKRPVALWRRPAFLGLAAGLFVLVTTSVVLLRQPLPSPAVQQKRTVEEPSPQGGLAEPKPDHAKPLPTAPAPQRQKTSTPAQDRLAPAEAQPAPAITAGGVGGTGFAVVGTVTEKKEKAPAPPAANVVEVVAATAESAPTTTRTQTNLSAEQLTELPKAGAPSAQKSLFVDTARLEKTSRNGQPFHRLEALGNGKFRLTVTRKPEGHLYLLKRSGTEAQLLAPQQPRALAFMNLFPATETFELTLNEHEHLDLYLLTEPAPDPKALPETGPVKGTRTRVK